MAVQNNQTTPDPQGSSVDPNDASLGKDYLKNLNVGQLAPMDNSDIYFSNDNVSVGSGPQPDTGPVTVPDPSINRLSGNTTPLAQSLFSEAENNFVSIARFGLKAGELESLGLPDAYSNADTMPAIGTSEWKNMMDPTSASPDTIKKIDDNLKIQQDISDNFIAQSPNTWSTDVMNGFMGMASNPFNYVGVGLADQIAGRGVKATTSLLGNWLGDAVVASSKFKTGAKIAQNLATGAMLSTPQIAVNAVTQDNYSAMNALTQLAFGTFGYGTAATLLSKFGKGTINLKPFDEPTMNATRTYAYSQAFDGVAPKVDEMVQTASKQGKFNFENIPEIKEEAANTNTPVSDLINAKFDEGIAGSKSDINDTTSDIDDEQSNAQSIIDDPKFDAEPQDMMSQIKQSSNLDDIPEKEITDPEKAYQDQIIKTPLYNQVKNIFDKDERIQTPQEQDLMQSMEKPTDEFSLQSENKDALESKLQDLKSTDPKNKTAIDTVKNSLNDIDNRMSQLSDLIKSPKLKTPLSDSMAKLDDLHEKQNQQRALLNNTSAARQWYNQDIDFPSKGNMENMANWTVHGEGEAFSEPDNSELFDDLERASSVNEDTEIKDLNDDIDKLKSDGLLEDEPGVEQDLKDSQEELERATAADPENKTGYKAAFSFIANCLKEII